FRQFIWIFALVCIGLGYLGSRPAEGGYVTAAQILTAAYFAHFLIILPLLSILDKPKPVPPSIADAILAKNKAA
ncbi:MAG: cytochrome b, partial [Planctomycetaceae bacterium]|nr:cytochrome b [Planctomycetaceae bacterium]